MTQTQQADVNLTLPFEDDENNQSQSSQTQQAPKPRMRCPDRSIASGQTLDETIAPDHQVRVVWELVETEIDTSALEANIKAVEGAPGRDATSPALLVALWIYAMLDSVTQARELERRCLEHDPYKWLCGGVSVNYHMLSNFRMANGQWLDEQIARVVQKMCDEGLASFEEAVGQDGMRTRAHAGASSFRSAAGLEKLAEEAQQKQDQTQKQIDEDPNLSDAQKAARARAANERIDRIGAAQEAQEEVYRSKEKRQKGDGKKARGSTTDPESRKMKMADGGTRPAFNVQLSTLLTSLVIIGAFVSNAGSDSSEAPPMVQLVFDWYDAHPKKVCMDGGFSTSTNIEPLAGKGLVVYAPVKKAEEKLAKGEDPYTPKDRDSEVMGDWRVRMGTEAAKAQYKERTKCELPNAWCRNHGLYQFVVRGLARVNQQLKWYVLAYNLERMVSLRKSKAAAQAA